MRYVLCLILFIPLLARAQVKITGRVIDFNKKPMANASVFLSNATIGSVSEANGTFILSLDKPGQYDLVVSVIGFETYTTVIKINTADINLGDITMYPKTIELKEVKVGSRNLWEKNYERFKYIFLGPSDNAGDCEILNPEILYLDYDTAKQVLSASSDDFLLIENKALGYQIKYLLKTFSLNYDTGIFSYTGPVLFEDLKGTVSQQKRWKKKRLEAYEGSSMHFLRALSKAKIDENNFVVYQMTKTPNPKWVPGRNYQFLIGINKNPMIARDLCKLTLEKGIYIFGYTDDLFIVYTKKRDYVHDYLTRAFGLPNYINTVVKFLDKYTFFDDNGNLLNPSSVLFDGAWSNHRVADLLPVDYEPEVTQ